MDKGFRYTYSVAAFPRVKYFYQRLKRAIPRWERILDAGGLPKCISQGKVKLGMITSLAQVIGDKVSINLFADSAFLKTSTLELPVHVVGDEGTEKITWSSFSYEKKKSIMPVVTVIVLPSLEEKNVKKLQAKLSGMSTVQLRDIIIYVEESKTNFTYTDLVKVNFQQEDIDLPEGKARDRSRCLNKQIQNVLEEMVVAVLDMMAAYNKVFIPKKCEDPEESLQDAVHLKLLKSLHDPFVVKDLSPDNISDEAERKPTEKELNRIAGAIGKNWEKLGLPLGIAEAKMSEIKLSHQSEASKVYHMLLTWQKKDRATLNYLLQLLEAVSFAVTVDMEIIQRLREESPAPTADSERDAAFHRKLMEFVAKKTKCVACDTLSKKYGISTNLINEFLNEDFFGYEKKVAEMMASMSLPCWPRDKSDNGVSTCRSFAHRCGLSMTKITHDTEEYIKTKSEILMLVKKLQFELFGLLEQTDVAIETQISDVPKLPLEFQHGLLEIPEVYGCGTLWGELELHLTEDLSLKSKDKVKELMTHHKYTCGYSTLLIKPPNLQTGDWIEQGSGIRATKLRPDSDGKYNYGSIGCFVRVKSNIVYERGASNVAQDKGKLHCITCAHCVQNCENHIEVYVGKEIKPLGVKSFEEFNNEVMDVATVKIHEQKIKCCETSMQESCEDSLFRHKWTFNHEAILRKTVFKYGSATGLTRGICMCNDYKTKGMMEHWNRNSNTNFDGDFNILIAQNADVQPGTHVEGTTAAAENQQMQVDEEKVFSENGDSGSVVCDDNTDTGDVIVMALLSGDIRSKEGKFLYSYSSNIQKVIEVLQQKYNCLIEPAT
ncbi:uncharacterized protein LOC123533372 [Mercenaria mercenaria]|uniref:uncharacterized protein LOC123533372 n=1 Tax=Mercenaria mercenaria TaxID=6596 RepID=UPI00234E632E|nr:uncharacterized protein LOC123533372 [Mercenaria mercenaria]XP_053376079.1 uncharacterized protein LOC123533372 [Mercenaria mercenaria]